MEKDDLKKENEHLKTFLFTQTKTIQDKLTKMFSPYMNIKDLINVKRLILQIKESRDILKEKYGDNLDYDMEFNIKLCSMICANYAFDTTLLSIDEKNKIIKDNNYISNLIKETTLSLVFSKNIDVTLSNGLFLHNPLINTILSISNKIKYEIDNKLIIEDTIKNHKDYPLLVNLYVYIKDSFNSIESIFMLLNHKAYTQALSVFRGVLEQTITIDTLAHFPKTLPRFFRHIDLKLKEALGNTKEIDSYLESVGINPKDMTLRSKYIDYGWLDEIDEFKKREKKMYRLKSMAELINKKEFYEWYANFSKYVHSNFIFTKLNYKRIVCDLISEITEITLNLVNLYSWLKGSPLDLYGFNGENYLRHIFSKTIEIINSKERNYDFLLDI